MSEPDARTPVLSDLPFFIRFKFIQLSFFDELMQLMFEIFLLSSKISKFGKFLLLKSEKLLKFLFI